MKNIVFTRIDDRLIHGQVMTAWVQYTGATEVVVVDDGVAKDMFMSSIMKSSMPAKIKLTILSIKDAGSYLQGEAKNEKIFILVKTPMVIVSLIQAGVAISTVGIGGMGARTDRQQLYRNISANDEERSALKELAGLGTNVFIQVITDDQPIELKKVL